MTDAVKESTAGAPSGASSPVRSCREVWGGVNLTDWAVRAQRLFQ